MMIKSAEYRELSRNCKLQSRTAASENKDFYAGAGMRLKTLPRLFENAKFTRKSYV